MDKHRFDDHQEELPPLPEELWGSILDALNLVYFREHYEKLLADPRYTETAARAAATLRADQLCRQAEKTQSRNPAQRATRPLTSGNDPVDFAPEPLPRHH